MIGENHAVRRGGGPLLVTCEHAAQAVPPDLADLGVDAELLDTHWGWDRWALSVLEAIAPRLDATTVASRVSRLVVDVNRAPDDPTLALPHAGGRPIPGNLELSAAARAARVARFHAPYHAAIDAELGRVVARHGAAALLVSLHSFTGRWPGQDRDFDVGVLFDRHEPLARSVEAALAAAGLRTRLNEPYSGASGLIYAAKRHGETHGVRYFELELNQDVLEDAAARARVADALAAVLGALRGRP
jgi:predicted N-formylglutamate amidohydrolase